MIQYTEFFRFSKKYTQENVVSTKKVISSINKCFFLAIKEEAVFLLTILNLPIEWRLDSGSSVEMHSISTFWPFHTWVFFFH